METRVLDAADPEELVANAFAGVPAESVFETTPKSLRLLVGPATGGLLRRVVPAATPELLAAVARGAETEVGTRMTLSLGDMADIARDAPAVATAVREGESLEALRGVDGSEPFLAAFEAFLDEFGHRAVGEFDPSRPRWRDDPAAPLGLVRARLDTEAPGAHRERLRDRQRRARDATATLLTAAGAGPLGAVRRPLVARLVRTYRAHIHLRDEPKHGSAHLFAAWHEALQRTGRHLVAAGTLSDAADVWFLHRGELDRLLETPTGPLPDLAARRRTLERSRRQDAPAVITSEGEAPLAPGPRGEAGPTTLVGTGVSPGVVEGRVRIVRDPSGVGLEPGDVLVCPSSDPAWTPLFAVASGLVTEVGGRLTHGALVAREYGLPAVVSVRGATTRLQEGQRVRVDGSRGTVELLDA
jgi:pyruvate,water dikinase